MLETKYIYIAKVKLCVSQLQVRVWLVNAIFDLAWNLCPEDEIVQFIIPFNYFDRLGMLFNAYRSRETAVKPCLGTLQ